MKIYTIIYRDNLGFVRASWIVGIKSPETRVEIVITIKVKILLKNVTSNLDAPILNNFSWAFGLIASAKVLSETNTRPYGWNVGVVCQSAAAKNISPKHIDNAQKYSTE